MRVIAAVDPLQQGVSSKQAFAEIDARTEGGDIEALELAQRHDIGTAEDRQLAHNRVVRKVIERIAENVVDLLTLEPSNVNFRGLSAFFENVCRETYPNEALGV